MVINLFFCCFKFNIICESDVVFLVIFCFKIRFWLLSFLFVCWSCFWVFLSFEWEVIKLLIIWLYDFFSCNILYLLIFCMMSLLFLGCWGLKFFICCVILFNGLESIFLKVVMNKKIKKVVFKIVLLIRKKMFILILLKIVLKFEYKVMLLMVDFWLVNLKISGKV